MKDSSQLNTHSRKLSGTSYTSIDQLRVTTNPFEAQARKKHGFPLRPAINIFLILLTTIQVFIVINSRIYLRAELVRTFLSIYIDQDPYPQLFNGERFYITLTNVTELKEHFQYMFERVNVIDQDSLVDFNYKYTKFYLHTQYKQFQNSQKDRRQTIHQINITEGILQPFNMSNITDIQLYLLQVQIFQIQITNLTLHQNWYGFEEKYTHSIRYYYIDNIKLEIGFNFRITNAMISKNDKKKVERQYLKNYKTDGDDDGGQFQAISDCVNGQCYYYRDGMANQAKIGDWIDDTEAYQFIYNIRIRVFYIFVFLLSIISLYLNYISIRRTYKFLYQQLTLNKQLIDMQEQNPDHYHHPLLGEQQQHRMRENIRKWVTLNNMTISDMKLQYYFDLLEFDLIFSTLANIFSIVAGFYLVAGFERQRIVGVCCLFSWLSVFKFIRNYQKLVIMYQLIKMSFNKVIKFFVEFLPVFISYTLLGLCLFPKVSFFSSMANTVTTLVGIMMGDSIQMITNAILEKNSRVLGIVYIFSFVFLFMHAIHNTLTSIIKEFFILKKIELVKRQKQRNKDQNYLYMDQVKIKAQFQKQQLPLKLTPTLTKALLRIKALNRTKSFHKQITTLIHQLQQIKLAQKWIIQQDQLYRFACVKEELVRRSIVIREFVSIVGGIEQKIYGTGSGDKSGIFGSGSIIFGSGSGSGGLGQSIVGGSVIQQDSSIITENQNLK